MQPGIKIANEVLQVVYLFADAANERPICTCMHRGTLTADTLILCPATLPVLLLIPA